jgi:uncharacterized protein
VQELIEIVHDKDSGRFFCRIGEKECSAEYDMPDEKTMDIYRTFVDASLRGKGIAEQLMRTVLDHAKKHNLKIRPTCSYVVSYLRRYPELSEMLTPETDLMNEGSCRLPGAS